MCDGGTERRPAAHFSPEALASWARICRQEVLEAVHKRDSWYYEFERHVAAPGPDGLPYEQVRATAEPMFVGYATKAATVHALAHLSAPVPLASVAHGAVGIESSFQQRAMFAHMYGDNFVDGGILQVAERPTPEDPFHFVGVTCSAFKQPVIRAREYLFFEHSGSVEDALGRLVIYKVARSMSGDAVDLGRVSARTSAQLVQGEMNITFLFRSSHDGARTDMKVQGMLRLDTKMPNWTTPTLVQPFFDGMENLGSVGASRALRERLRSLMADAPKLSKKRSLPSVSTASCRVCLRRKRALASMRTCMSCEREVCKSCTKKLHFVTADSPQTVWLRFCQLCVKEAASAGCDLEGVSSGSSFSGSTDREDTDSVSQPASSVVLGF